MRYLLKLPCEGDILIFSQFRVVTIGGKAFVEKINNVTVEKTPPVGRQSSVTSATVPGKFYTSPVPDKAFALLNFLVSLCGRTPNPPLTQVGASLRAAGLDYQALTKATTLKKLFLQPPFSERVRMFEKTLCPFLLANFPCSSS